LSSGVELILHIKRVEWPRQQVVFFLLYTFIL
jgi:hypothetical protein